MAITKLKHVKENPDFASKGMKACIEYVINPKKTSDGLWIGGNAGTELDEIYGSMMDTKNFYGKLNGRQCYHFVISFSGEEKDLSGKKIDTATTFEAARKFCEKYLGDNYDYVFAAHNDTKHPHAHIVFNSVSRTSGYKYHYKKGDWEKKIQPVTDSVCSEMGLPLLMDFEYVEDEIGHELTDTEKIKLFIDEAIKQVESFEEFLIVVKDNFIVREGRSREKGDYMSIKIDEKSKARRNYSLGRGYSYSAIKERIKFKDLELKSSVSSNPSPIIKNIQIEKFTRPRANHFMISKFQKKAFKRYWKHRKAKVENTNSYQFKKASNRVNELLSQCQYLISNDINSIQTLYSKQDEVNFIRKRLFNERDELQHAFTNDEIGLIMQYQDISKKLDEAIGEEEWIGKLENQLDHLKESFPIEAMMKKYQENQNRVGEISDEIRRIYKEAKMIEKIKADTLDGPVTIKI